jgi:hypothetical protein
MREIKLKPMTYKRVLITWIDSTVRKTVWWNYEVLNREITEAEKGEYFYSVGYLFKETKLNYYLANSIHFEDKKAVSFGQIFSIPKGCVLKIEHLKN